MRVKQNMLGGGTGLSRTCWEGGGYGDMQKMLNVKIRQIWPQYDGHNDIFDKISSKS